MANEFDDDFFQSQLKRLRTDPVGTLETCARVYAALDETHATATYRLLGILTEFIEIVRQSPVRKKALLEHGFWNGPGHKPKDGSFTLAATRFALRARRTKHRLYERARTYAIVVDHYLETDLSAEEVSANLAERTIKGVLKIQDEKQRRAEEAEQASGSDAAGQKAKAKSATATEETAHEPQRSEEIEADGKEEEGKGSEDVGEDQQLKSNPPQPQRGSGEAPRQAAGIRSSGEGPKRRNLKKGEIWFKAKRFYDEILAVAVNEEITVTLRRTPDEGEWEEFEATAVRR